MDTKGIYHLCLSKHGLINAFMQSLFGWALLYSMGDKVSAQMEMQSALLELQTLLFFEEKVTVSKIASIYRELHVDQPPLTAGKYKNTAMLLSQIIVDKIAFIEEFERQNNIDGQIKNHLVKNEKNLLLSLKERLKQIKCEKER